MRILPSFLFCLFLSVCPAVSWAQQEDAYWLLSRLAKTNSEMERVQLHCRLTKIYASKSPKDASRHAQLALAKVKNMKNDSLRFQVYEAAVFYLSHKPQPDLSRATHFLRMAQSLDTQVITEVRRIQLFESEGLIHTELDDYEEAQRAFNKMWNLAQIQKDQRKLADAALLLGYLFTKAKQPHTAKDYYLKAVGMYRNQGASTGQAQALLGLAETFYTLTDFIQSNRYVKQAQLLSRRASRSDLEGASFLLEGKINEKSGKHTAAIVSYEQAKHVASRTHDRILTGKANLSLARMRQSEDPERALGLLKEALAVLPAKQHGEEVIQGYKLMYQYYKKRNLAEAVLWLERYQLAKDDLVAADRAQSLERNQIRFATTQKDKDNTQLRAEKANTDYEIERQRVLNLLLLFFLTVSGIAGAFGYYYLRQRKLQALDLETVVAQRTLELSATNQTLEETALALSRSNKELERFAYIASHDLKSPLRNIIAFLTLIERKLTGHSDESLHQYLQYAINNAKHMNNLIQDVLEFSRLDTSNAIAAVAPVNTNDALLQAVLNLQEMITAKKGIVTVAQLPTLLGNETHITQLLQNLIGNGFKYNNNANPGVTISHQIIKGKHQFQIQDNGIGIAPEFQAQVFDMFKRLHRQDEYSGTGIGLAICKKIVEQAGGKIWLTSDKDKGCSFFFSWPISTASLN